MRNPRQVWDRSLDVRLLAVVLLAMAGAVVLSGGVAALVAWRELTTGP